jgi:hypothetical protein
MPYRVLYCTDGPCRGRRIIRGELGVRLGTLALLVTITIVIMILSWRPVSAKPISILAIGQSNMVGRFGPSDGSSPPSEAARAWDYKADKWTKAVLGKRPFWPAKGAPGAAGNLAYTFAQLLAKKCGGPVYLVILASGGKRIEYFLPEDVLAEHGWTNKKESRQFGSSLADEIMDEAGDAKRALSDIGAVSYNVLLVHQGESNSAGNGDLYAVYAQKAQALLKALRRSGVINEDTVSIFGEISRGYARSAEQRAALRKIQGIGVVPWDGIETFDKLAGNHNRHATGRGLNELGHRYFDTYMRLVSGACPGTTTRSAE